MVINEIIRGRIGFDGWLLSDDIGMEALSGDPGQRALKCVAAGCDVALHCSGKMDEMQLVAAAVPAMSADGEARLARAMATALVEDADGPDYAECAAKRDELLALV
jgi:beta-N-acetylhexosaminidase